MQDGVVSLEGYEPFQILTAAVAAQRKSVMGRLNKFGRSNGGKAPSNVMIFFSNLLHNFFANLLLQL